MRDGRRKKPLHEMLNTDMPEGIGIEQILINTAMSKSVCCKRTCLSTKSDATNLITGVSYKHKISVRPNQTFLIVQTPGFYL